MCSHYEDASDINRLLAAIGLSYGEPAPFDPTAEYERHPTLYAKPEKPLDMWPRYPGRFIRRHLNADVGDEAVPELEVVTGRWGLISPHTKPGGIEAAAKLSTFNARSEKARTSFTYRHAWKTRRPASSPRTRSMSPTGAAERLSPPGSPAPMMPLSGSLVSGTGGRPPRAPGSRATPCLRSTPTSTT